MIRARLIGSVLLLAGGIVSARAANESVAGLESCFQAARISDEICSRLPADPAQRMDCLQKARSAQLECLEHVLSATPAGPMAAPEATRSEPATTTLLPRNPSDRVSPGKPGRTGSPEQPAGTPSAEKSNSQPGITNLPELPGSPETPTGAIRSDISPKAADDLVRPNSTNWVVSETTSPVDYSPFVMALIRSPSPVKDAPTTLSVGCRKRHTVLMVRTDGTWTTTRGNELRVEYQINNQPAVGQPWILSPDGKTATYQEDPVGFLQSLPDGARLKIKVADRASSSHEATFQFDGFDAIRKKISTACKWTRAADKTSSGRR